MTDSPGLYSPGVFKAPLFKGGEASQSEAGGIKLKDSLYLKLCVILTLIPQSPSVTAPLKRGPLNPYLCLELILLVISLIVALISGSVLIIVSILRMEERMVAWFLSSKIAPISLRERLMRLRIR